MDMIGEKTECPACGAMIVVPEDDGVVRHGADEASHTVSQAAKSRTIRIELDDDL